MDEQIQLKDRVRVSNRWREEGTNPNMLLRKEERGGEVIAFEEKYLRELGADYKSCQVKPTNGEKFWAYAYTLDKI